MRLFKMACSVVCLKLVDAFDTTSDKNVSKKFKKFEKFANVDKATRLFKEIQGVPGLALGVAVDGKVVFSKGYGYSDVENLIKFKNETVIRIASVSKSITSILAAKLVDENKLNLDEPIQKYAPSFPEKFVNGEKVSITTRQLLSHLGGVRAYKTKAMIEEEKKRIKEIPCEKCKFTEATKEFDHSEYYIRTEFKSIENALKLFKNDDLIHKPGTKFLYTSHGWTLISSVLEGASSQTYEKLLKVMLREMGMNHTYLDRNDNLIENRSKYYKRDQFGRIVNVPSVNNSYKWAGGGLLSCVDDLLIFGQNLCRCYNNATNEAAFLTKETLQQFWTPVDNTERLNVASCPQYAMGWCIADWLTNGLFKVNGSDRFYVGHAGGAVGASSYILIKPKQSQDDHDVVVVLLTNLQECRGMHELVTVVARMVDSG